MTSSAILLLLLVLSIGAPPLVVGALSLTTKMTLSVRSTHRSIRAYDFSMAIPRRPTDVMDERIADRTISTGSMNRRKALVDIVGRRGRLLGATLVIASTRACPAYALKEGNKSPPRPTKALGEEYRQGTAALGDSNEAEILPRESYKKLPSGVIYADISPGSSNDDVVKEGSKVNVQWVLRRSNGYFVDSSAVSDSIPFIFTVGNSSAIRGLDEGIRGMKVGGSRRILIPPALAYVDGVDDGKPGPIPAGFGPRQQIRRVMQVRRDVPGEYIFLEVKVTKVR